MSENRLKNDNKAERRIIFCSVLLSAILVIASAIAWFSMGNTDDKKDVDLSIGKVRYSISEPKKMFFTMFDFDEGIEDDFDPDDGYFPATKIEAIKIGGIEIQPDSSGIYRYNLAENSKTRITVDFDPENSSDKLNFESTDNDTVKVSEFGTIRGLGDPNSADNVVTITVTATDRSPSSYEGHRDSVLKATIIITLVEGTSNDYSYLPPKSNVLKNPVTLVNSSTVDTKLRVKISFSYSDYEGTNDKSGRSSVNAAEIINGIKSPNLSNAKINLVSPLRITLNTSYSFVSPGLDELYLTDASGNRWTIEELYLTEAEKTSLISSLEDPNENNFYFKESMINKACIYICYNENGTGTDSVDKNEDYGTTIAKVNKDTADNDETRKFMPVTEIYTGEKYAGFSDRKIMNISVNYQARQSGYYDESDWFDVYCKNGHSNCLSR